MESFRQNRERARGVAFSVQTWAEKQLLTGSGSSVTGFGWSGCAPCFFFLFGCSVVSDSLATPGTVARQASLSMGFSRPGYWSGLPFPPPGDFPDPGIEPASPALAGRLFTDEPPIGEAFTPCTYLQNGLDPKVDVLWKTWGPWDFQ